VSDLENIGDRLLVVFDGHCGFCNRSVRWFLTRDRNDRLRFVPSESPKVAAILARYEITQTDDGLGSPTLAPSTIVVIRDLDNPAEQVLVRSNAAIAMLRELPRPWPVPSCAGSPAPFATSVTALSPASATASGDASKPARFPQPRSA
jgi:predicted DCC family thiol-disulfide oxidoreductase YuxK